MKNITPTTDQTVSKPNVQRAAHLTDDQAAARLIALHAEANAGLRKVIALGLFLFDLQENHLKHGQFQTWCKAHVPTLSYRGLASYMQLTKSVLEDCGYQVRQSLPLAQGGQLLLCAPDELAGDAAALRAKICAVIDGKSARQLMLEFKSVEEDGDGLRVKRGRRIGEGGLPAVPTDPTELIAHRTKEALRRMGKVDDQLNRLGLNFALQPDAVLEAWVGTLERTLVCAKRWLNTPLGKRDPEMLGRLWEGH